MVETRLSFEQRKFILKCYWKYENAVEVQRRSRRKVQTDPPIRLTIRRIRDKFEADGNVQNVHKQRSGRPRTSTNAAMEERVLETYRQNSRTSVRQASRELELPKDSVHRILKRFRWKSYIPKLVHALNEDDPDRRMEFCEWYLAKCEEDQQFPIKL